MRCALTSIQASADRRYEAAASRVQPATGQLPGGQGCQGNEPPGRIRKADGDVLAELAQIPALRCVSRAGIGGLRRESRIAQTQTRASGARHSALGALERAHTRAKLVADAKAQGAWVVVAEQTTASVRPEQVVPVFPAVLVLGGECSGVSSEAIEAADAAVAIPMLGTANSPNLATAAAILLYWLSLNEAMVCARLHWAAAKVLCGTKRRDGISDRSLIFNAKGAQIGYIEADRAFDLTGRERTSAARAGHADFRIISGGLDSSEARKRSLPIASLW